MYSFEGKIMWEYTEKVKEYFVNPKNIGALQDANAIGEVGSLSCGDALKLYLKVENDVIIDASFETFGCASAIASSSALTEMLKGMKIEDAEKLTNKDIADFLGGLPKEKLHCSVMGAEALEAAIRNYKGLPPIEHEEEGKLICYCFNVSEETIRKAIEVNNLQTLEDVTQATKAGGGCRGCHDAILDILDEMNSNGRKEQRSSIQTMQKIMMAMYKGFIQSLPRQDAVEILSVEGNIVRVNIHVPKEQRSALLQELETLLQNEVDSAIVVKEVLL